MTDADRAAHTPLTRHGEAVAAGRPVGRSHRLHRPRGGSCARGYCQQCPLEAGGLACETPAGAGALRRGRLDPLRPLAWFGERMEPWFYETRFLRPRAARQPALEILRRLSAAHRLPTVPATTGEPERRLQTDVVVVGGGPAGLAAAAVAAAQTSVVVVTRTQLGGALPLDDDVAARAAADARTLREAGGTVLERAVCTGWYEEEDRLVVIADGGPVSIHASRIVVATGAYDRPLVLEGADLPGVVGLRGFQLLAAQGALTRRSVGVIGTGEELRRALATARAFAGSVRWVAGVRAAPDDFGVPTHHTAVRAVQGRRRARGVLLDDGTRLAADVVVVATTQPTYELQLQLGATPTFAGEPAVIRADGPTLRPTLVVGEAAGWSDPGSTAERAAEATAAWLAGDDPVTIDPVGDGPRVAAPGPAAVVCVCEDVRQRDVDRAIDEGFGDVELVKRRSGATTGACQGKLCLPLLAERFAARGFAPAISTVRPPVRPVRIGDLAGGEP